MNRADQNPVLSIIRGGLLFVGSMALLLNAGESQSPSFSISGTVRDANSYREIPGVNILIVGTQYGTSASGSGRYVLKIPADVSHGRVRFQHISYYPLEMNIDSLSQKPDVLLQPRIITMPGVEVVSQGERPSFEILRDLPQAVTMLDASKFELRGFVDAGDYLRTDAAIQVDEMMSGRKTLSLRGGNSDDVVVLYNGVKLNSLLDNTFDFSLIDLDRLQRFEVIRGGNTALFGPEAFSGVINIVPQLTEKYLAQLQYRIGTYSTENITLNLNKSFRRVTASYGFKASEVTRQFAGANPQQNLVNRAGHHTLDVQYLLPTATIRQPAKVLHLTFLHSDLKYDNHRDHENDKLAQNLLSLKYSGTVAGLQDFHVLAYVREFEDDLELKYQSSPVTRSVKEQSVCFHTEKVITSQALEWVAGYQFSRSNLDLFDDRQEYYRPLKEQDAKVVRLHHGLVMVGKIKGPTGSNVINSFEVNLSGRFDSIQDDQQIHSTLYQYGKKGMEILSSDTQNDTRHQATSLKLASSLNGHSKNTFFQSYLNVGANSKFPTLVQSMGNPILFQKEGNVVPLKVERVRSLELGMEIRHEIQDPWLSGWTATANYFQNHYDNKFRAYSTPGIPITFYDNVPVARISGSEGKYGVYFLRNKISTELSLTKLYISEKAAFPFKSDFKVTMSFNIDHAGYFLNVLGFHESEQTGWLRTQDNEFIEILLPAQTNVDVHLGKIFHIRLFKCFVNFSGRNLLNTQQVLMQGLALRDKRFYLSVGLQI